MQSCLAIFVWYYWWLFFFTVFIVSEGIEEHEEDTICHFTLRNQDDLNRLLKSSHAHAM